MNLYDSEINTIRWLRTFILLFRTYWYKFQLLSDAKTSFPNKNCCCQKHAFFQLTIYFFKIKFFEQNWLCLSITDFSFKNWPLHRPHPTVAPSVRAWAAAPTTGHHTNTIPYSVHHRTAPSTPLHSTHGHGASARSHVHARTTCWQTDRGTDDERTDGQTDERTCLLLV